jgi:tight adherence protein C
MDQIVFILCVFGAVTGAAYWVSVRVFGTSEGDRLRGRLSGSGMSAGGAAAATTSAGGGGGAVAAVMPVLQRLGEAAAQPFMPSTREKQSGMRRDLAKAGIYAPRAIAMVTGGKVVCLVLGLVCGYLAGSAMGNILLGFSFGGLLGYVLPNMWVRMKIKANQKSLTFGLPDALDLMVVCVEAGLTIDAAVQRVGEELVLAHPSLSREFGIAHMETRVGLSRVEALRNLASRTGNDALASLSSMLTQADRFGTSIAQALRVHAESLRIARQQAAEEMAGKASVKLSFPLVLFIFPATFIVLAGPTIVEMMTNEFFR